MTLTDSQVNDIIDELVTEYKNKYKTLNMGYQDFMYAYNEYIYTLEQGDLVHKDDAYTREEWQNYIREEMKEHDELISVDY